jgi:peptidylprolyl isomerase
MDGDQTDRRPMILFGALALLGLIVAVILLAGGGDGDDDGGGASAEPTAEKPAVEIPDGPAPKQLQVEDLEEGEGDPAEAGDKIAVQYVGVLYENGKEFDSNWGSGEPFEIELGAGEVIPGWDQGLEGMKVGGLRQLTIPPELAYGKQGSPPAIPPNSPLVFVVELVEIK